MEDFEHAVLHYSMLEYLFKHLALTQSSSSAVWEGFKAENPEFFGMSAEELKMMFWRDVFPDIDNFELLTDDMMDYFKQESIYTEMDPQVLESLAHNEPKGEGKDYKVLMTPDLDDVVAGAQEEPSNLLRVTEAFRAVTVYEGSFAFDTDSDDDENCMKIATKAQLKVEQADDFLASLLKAFGAVLGHEGNQIPTREQIAEELANPDVLKDAEDLKKLPKGVQQYLHQFEMFKPPVREETDDLEENQENYDANSLLDVPGSYTSARNNSTRSSGVLTDTSNQAVVGLSAVSTDTSTRAVISRKTRSTSSNSSFKTPAQASTPFTPTTSKLLTAPSLNARMGKFMTKFKSAKRRRSSPEPK